MASAAGTSPSLTRRNRDQASSSSDGVSSASGASGDASGLRTLAEARAVIAAEAERLGIEEDEEPVRPRRIWKTVTAAVLLFTVGTLMLVYGVPELRVNQERGIAMCVVGSIAFIPGIYASFILLGAALGWQGYSYDQLPSYDDD
jgi:hypothetical protein